MLLDIATATWIELLQNARSRGCALAIGLSANETPIGVRETAISDIFALDIR